MTLNKFQKGFHIPKKNKDVHVFYFHFHNFFRNLIRFYGAMNPIYVDVLVANFTRSKYLRKIKQLLGKLDR